MLTMFCSLQHNRKYELQASYASCVVPIAEGGKADRDIVTATLDITMGREGAAMYYPVCEGASAPSFKVPSRSG